MKEKKRSLLDSSALLSYLNREDGFESVRSLLRSARASDELLLINDINLAEVFYSRARRTSLAQAESFLAQVPSLPLEVVGNSFGEIMDAARLKAQYPIAFGDAFAVATAIRLNAAIYTSDNEFQAVAKLVEVRVIRYHA